MKNTTPEDLLNDRCLYRPGKQVSPDNVGEFLLCKAKSSPKARLAIAKALLLPWPESSPLPHIGDRALLSALRVATWGSNSRHPQSTEGDDWPLIIEKLLSFVQFQKQHPSLREVIRARPELRIVAESCGIEPTAFEDQITQLTNVEVHISRVRYSHPGGRFSERRKRLLAAIMLFHLCGAKKQEARELVSKLLYGQGEEETLEADSLERLEERYRKAFKRGRQDADTALEHLTLFWLHRLGDLIMLIDCPEEHNKFSIAGGPMVTRWKETSSGLAGTCSPSSKRSSQTVRGKGASMPDVGLPKQLRHLRSLVPEVPRMVPISEPKVLCLVFRV